MGAQLVFNIGVSLILFHGGTGISLREITRSAVGLGLLVLPGVFLTADIVALAVATVFGVPLSVALMVGAVLAATDPDILIPLFADIRLRPKVVQTVVAESDFNDPVSTVFALAVAGAVASGEVSLSGPAFEFVQSLFLGTLIGVVAGVTVSYLVSMRRGGARVAGRGDPRGSRPELLLS